MFLFNFIKTQLQIRLFCARLIVMIFLLFSNLAGSSTQEYDVKAVFLFHFIDFVNWPEGKSNQEDRNICIYGSDPFDSRLRVLADADLQQKTVHVLSEISLASSSKCHTLYVGQSKRKQLDEIIDYLADSPILTVSDIGGFASRRGMIGFTVKSGKVKLEVNLNSVKASGIKLSSNLIEIATVVENRFNSGLK